MPAPVRPDATSLASAGLFVLVVAGFGSAFALNAVAVTTIPPIWVAAIRAGVACTIFVAVVLATGRRIGTTPRDIGTYALIGLTTGAVLFFLLAWGQRIVPSSLAGVLFASVPLMTVFLSWGLFGGPRPTGLGAASAVLGLIGVAIAFPDAASVDRDRLIGATAVLLAAVSYAFGGIPSENGHSYSAQRKPASSALRAILRIAASGHSLRQSDPFPVGEGVWRAPA